MEKIINPVRKLSFQKKRPKKGINLSKMNIELHPLVQRQDINNSEIVTKNFPSQFNKRRKEKFNSIDNVSLNFNNKNKTFKIDEASSPRKNRKIPKNNNYYEEYLEKLYEDEPHFKKSVFKKKINSKIKNFNRKVSFLSPKNKKKQIINLFKVNPNNLLENNDSKSRIIKEDDMGDEQSYGFDKKYSANILKKTKNDDLLKSSIFNKKDFDGRNIKRKQTNKTSKSNNIRNSEKKNISINIKRDSKKKNSSKTNDKRFKKKISKVIKDKDKISKDKNNKDKNNKDKNIAKIININNNININNDDKQKIDKNKQKNCLTMVDKNDKKNENNNSESRNKKKQDLSPKKSIENVETLVQVVQQNNKKNKKLFCCVPFLICLKNKEENKNNIL